MYSDPSVCHVLSEMMGKVASQPVRVQGWNKTRDGRRVLEHIGRCDQCREIYERLIAAVPRRGAVSQRGE